MAQHSTPRPSRSSTTLRRRTIHLGVDLSATAARPAVWRTHGSRAARAFDRDAATRLARVAAHGALDFVALGAGFTLGTSRDTSLGGVLDPAVGACRVARDVPGVGAVAHLDPGKVDATHVAQALAAVDEHTQGRAGWQISRATIAQVREVQRAWDAIVGAAAVDETEQRVTHDGVRFAVRGQSPGARPGQSRIPVVVALGARPQSADDGAPSGHVPVGTLPPADDGALELAGHVADVVRIRAADLDEAVVLRERVRSAVADAGRDPDDVRVLVDLFAVIGPDPSSSAARLDLLRRLEDEEVDDGSLVVAGSPVALAVTIQDWVDSGAADGFVVRPAALATDLDAFVAAVVPVLQGSGYLRTAYPGATLRSTLALPQPRTVVAV